MKILLPRVSVAVSRIPVSVSARGAPPERRLLADFGALLVGRAQLSSLLGVDECCVPESIVGEALEVLADLDEGRPVIGVTSPA